MNKKEISRPSEDATATSCPACRRFSMSPSGRGGLPLRHACRRRTVSGVRRHRAAGTRPRSWLPPTRRSRAIDEDYEMAPPAEPRRAPQAGRRHLERRERRSRRGHGRELRQVQPHLHDGVLRRSRQHQSRSASWPVCEASPSDPKGEIIDRPIKANFREGLSVLE